MGITPVCACTKLILYRPINIYIYICLWVCEIPTGIGSLSINTFHFQQVLSTDDMCKKQFTYIQTWISLQWLQLQYITISLKFHKIGNLMCISVQSSKEVFIFRLCSPRNHRNDQSDAWRGIVMSNPKITHVYWAAASIGHKYKGTLSLIFQKAIQSPN